MSTYTPMHRATEATGPTFYSATEAALWICKRPDTWIWKWVQGTAQAAAEMLKREGSK